MVGHTLRRRRQHTQAILEHKVNVANLLPWERSGEYDWQFARHRLANGAWAGLRHDHVCRMHEIRHIPHEAKECDR